MEKLQFTLETKEYGSGRLPFTALLVKLNGDNVFVERFSGIASPVFEKAIEKITTEFAGQRPIEMSLLNIKLPDGEQEYLSDKFHVVFA